MVCTKRLKVFRCGHAMTTYAGAVGGCTVRFTGSAFPEYFCRVSAEAAAVGVSTTLGP